MFKKYPSLENHYRSAFTQQCFEQYGNLEWIATEKIHGANFSFLHDGTVFQCAKRSGLILRGEKFYNYQSLLSEFELKMENLHNAIQKHMAERCSIQVFGELFGPGVQKGIKYGDKVAFSAFDIRVETYGGVISWLDWDTMVKLCESYGIPVVPVVARGSFENLIEVNNEFDSLILGVADNMAEGYVMRPLEVKFLLNGSRAIIKSKNSKWSEKIKSTKPKPVFKLNQAQTKLMEDFSQYVSENRLKNILSKFGPVTNRDFGKLSGLLIQDALVEFERDEYEVDKDDWKVCKRVVMQMAAELIRPNFLNIIDGNY